jgi:cobalt-zinc-cadmium efflux system outer membrane protein
MGRHPFYHYGQNYILFSIRQPLELGHQTTHRYNIARAALSQQQWTVVQAELAALVQTYRFFQTAEYRREKLRVATDLGDFNDRLVQALRRRLEANQIQAADVVLAEVENEATGQLVDVARQDYANALADLRNQLGMPESAGSIEPLGEFVLPTNIPPVEEEALIRTALQSRPEIHAARAAARGALAAVNLARGDRIPTPVVGPQYAMDEAGIQYIGLVLVSPMPILNGGGPLVRQREADYRRALTTVEQVEKRTVIQVKAAAAKWNAATRLVSQTAGLTDSLRTHVQRMERLFEENQTDLTKLLQARQRLIQLENARLDALWQATQAQSDLLLALGVPNLIAGLNPQGVPPPAR